MNRQDALHALKLPASAKKSEIEKRLRRKEKSLKSGLKNALNSDMRVTYERRLKRLQTIRTCLEHEDSSIKSRGRADSDVDALAHMLSMTNNPNLVDEPSESMSSGQNLEDKLDDDPLDVDDSWLDPEEDPPNTDPLESQVPVEPIEEEEEDRTKTTEATVATYDAFYDLDLDELDADLPTTSDLEPAPSNDQDGEPAPEALMASSPVAAILNGDTGESAAEQRSPEPEHGVPVEPLTLVAQGNDDTAILINDSATEAASLVEPEADAASIDSEMSQERGLSSTDTRDLLKDAGGRFEILERVPSSPTYQHFKAKDLLRNETVLLKTLAENFAQDHSSQKTFRQTALAMSRVSHPNLIKVFDLHHFSGQLYVSMEWLEPYSLRDEIETRKRNGHCFESYELMRIGRELRDLLSTLQILVPHCGMKPENIHYQESGALKLIDIDPFDHRSSYAAQELQQVDGKDNAADQFSMAVLLSELAAVPSEKIGYLERAGKDIPGGFFTAVQRAQSKDPEQRFPDLDSFVTALSSRGDIKPSWRRPVLQLAALLFVFVLGLATSSMQSRIEQIYHRVAARTAESDDQGKELREVNRATTSDIPLVETEDPNKPKPQSADCILCMGSAQCVTCRGQGQLMDSCKSCSGLSKIKRPCSDCDPQGKKSCENCEGTGKRTPKCIQCDGQKSLECEECLGKKTISQRCADCQGRKSGPCRVCKSVGTVKKTCKDCLGKKEMPCVQCNGQVQYTVPCDYVLNYMGKSSPCKKGEVICPECNGAGKTGRAKCDLCDGSGRQDCVKFCQKGRIKKTCNACQKTGRQACTNKRCRLRGSWQIECANCLGLKKADCQSCKATGKQSRPCKDCQGQGRSPCTACKGEGRLSRDCPSCKGKGRSNCYRCSGKRVVEENCEDCENGRNAKDCLHCKGSGRCPKVH